MVDFLGWHITRNQPTQPQHPATSTQLYNTEMRTKRSDYANGFAPINSLVQEMMGHTIYPVDDYGHRITYNYPKVWEVLQHPNTSMDFRTFMQTGLIGFLSNPSVRILCWHGSPNDRPGYTSIAELSGLTFLPRSAQYNVLNRNEYRVAGKDGSWTTVTDDDVATLTYSIDPDMMVPVSPGSASHDASQILDSMNLQLRAYFQNSATPQLLVTIHAPTRQEFDSIRRSFQNANRGSANRYGTVYQYVSDTGITADSNPTIDITPVGANADNLDVQHITDYASKQLSANLGVSPLIYGDTDATSYQNQEVVNDKFNKRAVETLRLFLSKLAFELNRITGGIGFRFAFDYDDVEYAEKELTQAQTLESKLHVYQALIGMSVPPMDAAKAANLPQSWYGLHPEPATMPLNAITGSRLTVDQRHPDTFQRLRDLLIAIARKHAQRRNGLTVDDSKYLDETMLLLNRMADKGGSTAARQLAQQIRSHRIGTKYEMSGATLKNLRQKADRILQHYGDWVDTQLNQTDDSTVDHSLTDGIIAAHATALALMLQKTGFLTGMQDKATQVQDDMTSQGEPVLIRKVWVTQHDDRVCEFCQGMDGQEAGVNEGFDHGTGVITADNGETLMPDDTDIPDGHPNCRCTYRLEVTRLGED